MEVQLRKSLGCSRCIGSAVIGCFGGTRLNDMQWVHRFLILGVVVGTPRELCCVKFVFPFAH